MDKIKIVIVDDHQVVIDGIRAMLSSSDKLEIVGQAHDGKEAQDVIRILNPDLVLMDISMPEMDGIEATRKIKSNHQEIKILMLSMLKERSMIKKALAFGASGYVLKNEGRDELIHAIERVYNGDKYISDELNTSSSSIHLENKSPIISRREKQVLTLIVREYTAREIAEELYITQHTVDAHRKNLLLKLGVRNTAGLVREAMKYGLVNNLDSA